MEETRRWRYGAHRWFVLLFIIMGVVFAKMYAPIMPHIQVAPEHISHTPLFGDFYVTNTMLAMLIMDVLIVLFFLPFMRAAKKGSLLPEGGFAGAGEAIVEMLYNMVETTAGKATKTIFPWVTTIFITVLVANLMELIPGVDSIGFFEEVEHKGHAIANTFIPGVMALVKGEGHYMVTAYIRVLSTDRSLFLLIMNYPMREWNINICIVETFINSRIDLIEHAARISIRFEPPADSENERRFTKL